jgi:hypothetical protein
MEHSKTLEKFISEWHPLDCLLTPEKYFGPNYESVFNFWTYIDTLDEEQLRSVERSSRIISRSHKDTLVNIATKTVYNQYCVWDTASESYRNGITACFSLGYATLEIVCMHKLFDEHYRLFYLPLFGNL